MTADRIRYRQPVLIKRGHDSADDLGAFVREALRDIRAYMHEPDLQPDGPPFAISIGSSEDGTIDVEVGWPLDRPTSGAGAVRGATLPHTLARHTPSPRVIA